MIEKGINQEAVIKWVVSNYENWKEARKDKEAIWTECLNAYLTEVDESAYEKWPWRCKVADTFIQEIGDTITAAIRNALFPTSEEYYQLVGTDEIGKLYEEEMQIYFDELLKQSKFLEKIKPFLKQLVVLGNAPALMPWVKRVKTKKERGFVIDETTGLPSGIEIRDRTKVVEDNFGFECLDAFDVVFNPSVVHFDQTPIIRRVETSLANLKEMADVYSNLDKVKNMTTPVSDDSEDDKQIRATTFGLTYEPLTEGIERLEAYGDFEIDGKIYKNYIVVVANRSVLLRFEENPFWGGRPIVWGTYDSLWFTSYGKGACEPILGIYSLINTFTNQKADILNLIINGCFTYVNDGVIDTEELILRPGGFIEEGVVGNIRPIHPNTNVTLAFTEIASLRQQGDRSSGASDYEKGAVPGGKRTAYETNIIKQGSSSRFNDITKHIGDTVVEHCLNFFLDCVKQFKWGSGKIVDEALLGHYRINFKGAELTATKTYDIQQFILFSDIIARNPVFAQAINPIKYLEKWRKLMGVKKEDGILKTEEEMAQQQQQIMQTQGATPNMGGQGGTNPDEAMVRAMGNLG